MPDGEGGTWWRPSSLEDVHAVPARVLLLMDLFRMGIATGRDPWRWWHTSPDGPYHPAATRAHLYRVGWQEPHQAPAKCGYQPPDGTEWRAAGAQPDAPCRECSGEREQQGSGVIGGVDIRTRQRVEG